jgi:hypothetical protein
MKLRPKLLIRTAARAQSGIGQAVWQFFVEEQLAVSTLECQGSPARRMGLRDEGLGQIHCTRALNQKKEPRPPVWLYVCPAHGSTHQSNCAREGGAKLLVRPNVSKTCHAAPHRMDSTFVALRGYPAAARHCPIERFTDRATVRSLPPCSVVIGTAAYKHSGRKGRNRKQLHSSPNSRLSQEHPYQLG